MENKNSENIHEIIRQSNEKRKIFMKDYDKLHKVCPKCGSDHHMSTLVGYIFNSSNPESYKDLNHSTCMNCQYQCTIHERISEEEFLRLNPQTKNLPSPWKEIKVNNVKCFQLFEEPELLYIIKTYENRYIVIHEDSYDLDSGKSEIKTKEQIKEQYNINLDRLEENG